jgi:hypothetical protein
MNTIRLVVGSIVVYAIVACGSAATGPSFVERAVDASSPNPFDAAGMVGAVRDALANPVREASAQALAPIVATETCNKTGQVGGVPVLYAEHAFPGKTATQLAGVQVLVAVDPASSNIPGYSQSQVLAYVRDGD